MAAYFSLFIFKPKGSQLANQAIVGIHFGKTNIKRNYCTYTELKHVIIAEEYIRWNSTKEITNKIVIHGNYVNDEYKSSRAETRIDADVA